MYLIGTSVKFGPGSFVKAINVIAVSSSYNMIPARIWKAGEYLENRSDLNETCPRCAVDVISVDSEYLCLLSRLESSKR